MSVKELDESVMQELHARRLAIEADEPPTKFALNVLCHNELVRALGLDNYYRVPWWQRLFAQVFSFHNATFELIQSSKTASSPSV